MASRRTAAPQTETPQTDAAPQTETPQTTGFTFEVRESAEPIKHTRSEKPNPLAAAYKSSLDTGKTLEIPVPNADVAKVVANHLRRAAKDSNAGLSFHYYTEAGVVRFRAKAEKVKRSYSAADIRKWAKENDVDDKLLFPRIDPRVRAAFKDAHQDASDE